MRVNEGWRFDISVTLILPRSMRRLCFQQYSEAAVRAALQSKITQRSSSSMP